MIFDTAEVPVWLATRPLPANGFWGHEAVDLLQRLREAIDGANLYALTRREREVLLGAIERLERQWGEGRHAA